MNPHVNGFRLLVVTPTLGTSPWLDETVTSVRRLDFPCTHALVTPRACVERLASRYSHAVVLPEPGGGMYPAINAGLAGVTDWTAFTYINDDDLLLPRISRVVTYAQTASPRVVYGGVRLLDTNGRRVGAIPISPLPALNRDLYAQRVEPVYQHGTVFTRAVVEKLGPFDTTLRFCGDSEMLARCCIKGIEFKCATPNVVAAFRLRAGQLTKDLPAMEEEHHRVYAKLRLPAERLTLRHRWARFVFCICNAPVYVERIARHGFIPFSEVLARVK